VVRRILNRRGGEAQRTWLFSFLVDFVGFGVFVVKNSGEDFIHDPDSYRDQLHEWEGLGQRAEQKPAFLP